MQKDNNLWIEVGNKCLKRASELLDSEYLTTEETAETVKHLVDAAVQIDLLNLRREESSRRRAESYFSDPSAYENMKPL